MTRSVIILFSLLLANGSLIGQIKDSLPSDEVQVIKRFKSNIKHSSKISFSPDPLVIDTSRRSYDYSVDFITPNLETEKARLEYRPLRPSSLYAPNHLYAKIGYGTPQQALVDVSYGQLDPDIVAWNMDFKHQSNHVEDSYNDFAHSEGGIMGLFLINQDWSVEGNLRSSQVKNQYFPLYQDSSYEESDATRKWSSIMPSVKVHGHWHDLKLDATLDYRYDKENIASESSIFKQRLEVEKNWNERHLISVHFDHQAGSQELDTFENKLPIIQLHPAYAFVGEKLAIEAGIKLLKTEDLSVIPDITLSYAFDNKKSIRLELTGTDQPWTLPIILAYNPFISNLQNLDFIEKSREASATWRHRVSRLNYHLKASYTSLEDRAFYLNNKIESHTFDLVPGEGSSINLSLGMDLDLNKQSALGLLLEKSYFNLKNQVKPWHIPTYQVHIFGEHSLLSENLWLKIELIMQGDAAYKEDFTSDILDPYVFLGLKSRYRFSDHWSAFLDINNILNQSNTLFLGYETIGFNFTTGIILKY